MQKLTTMLALAAVAGSAAATIEVTEAYVGLSGEDGTSDWIELTWTGAGTFDTGALFYDDANPDFGNAGQLDSFILSTGESAIFLIDDNTDAIGEFTALWGAGANVGLTNGGGGLGQNGDQINLFDAMMSIVESVDTVGEHTRDSNAVRTFQYDAAGNQSDSIAGIGGANASNFFFNDNIGVTGDMIRLVGSPAGLPTPGAAALLGMGGLVASRRRR